jgi:hypothetical protein
MVLLLEGGTVYFTLVSVSGCPSPSLVVLEKEETDCLVEVEELDCCTVTLELSPPGIQCLRSRVPTI